MRRAFFSSLGFVAILTAGVFAWGDKAPQNEELLVDRLSANMYRVYANGRWEDVPLRPLAPHLCASGETMYTRYCD